MIIHTPFQAPDWSYASLWYEDVFGVVEIRAWNKDPVGPADHLTQGRAPDLVAFVHPDGRVEIHSPSAGAVHKERNLFCRAGMAIGAIRLEQKIKNMLQSDHRL